MTKQYLTLYSVCYYQYLEIDNFSSILPKVEWWNAACEHDKETLWFSIWSFQSLFYQQFIVFDMESAFYSYV